MSTSSVDRILAVVSPSTTSIATASTSIEDRVGVLEQRQRRLVELLRAVPNDNRLDERTRASQLALLQSQATELQVQMTRLRDQQRAGQAAPTEPETTSLTLPDEHLIDLIA